MTSPPETNLITPPADAEPAPDAQAAQAIEDALDELRRKARRNINTLLPLLGLFSFFGLLLFVMVAGDPPRTGPPPNHVGLWVLPLTSALCVLCMYRLFHKKPSFDADALSKQYGVRVIPAFLDYLRAMPSQKEMFAIHAALTTLLPQMKASDAHLLSLRNRLYIKRGSWDATNKANREASFYEYHVAILKALEQVGDLTAIPVVIRLANLKTRNANLLRVKQAAIECLPMLQANCGNVEATKTLLRPSSPDMASPDTLLRAASGAGAADEKQLLRAANSDSLD